MKHNFLKIRTAILSSCAIMALSACETGWDDKIVSYEHPADSYYGTENPSGANYPTSQRDVQGYYAKKKSSGNDKVSVAQKEPSYSISIDDEDGSSMVEPAAHDMNRSANNQFSATPVSPQDQSAQPAMITGKEPATPQMQAATTASAPAAPLPAGTSVPTTLTGCPTFEVYPDMRSITFFKGGDKTKLIAEASIGEVRGTCRLNDGLLELDLRMLIDGRLGQHGHYQSDPEAEELQSYPYYVALVNKATGKIEYKKIFASILRFPPSRNVESKYEDIIAFIPMPRGQVPEAYILNIGFQLTSEQLSYNRGELNTKAQPVMATEITTKPSMHSMSRAPQPVGEVVAIAPPRATAPVAPKSSAPMIGSDTGSEPAFLPTPSHKEWDSQLPAQADSGQVPITNNTPVENAYIGTYATSDTSVSRDRRFLRGRPRVSVDPLDD